MFKEKITYTDYDGVVRTETFYFNFTKSELLELQLMYPGGYAEYIDKTVDSQDRPKLMAMFKDLIKRTYGEKTEDGRRLIKSEELSNAFVQTPAYDQLFMKLASDNEYATSFVLGVMPDMGDPDKKQEILDKTKAKLEEKKLLTKEG